MRDTFDTSDIKEALDKNGIKYRVDSSLHPNHFVPDYVEYSFVIDLGNHREVIVGIDDTGQPYLELSRTGPNLGDQRTQLYTNSSPDDNLSSTIDAIKFLLDI